MSRHWSAFALVTGLITALVLVPAPQASAKSWDVPGRASITVKGHGYGHGHGLSQYGALGAARQGVGYRRIVDFYYPRTKWALAGGAVKVLISADTSSDVVVSARGGLSVRSLASGKSWNLAGVNRDAKRWRILPVGNRRSEIGYLTGRWHSWRVVAGEAQFAAGGKPMRLHLPGSSVRYRGVLRSTAPGGTRRDTVNILPLDSYLKGVLPREVPALWPQQAVRAQAIAARTYAAYERAHPIARHYQICDTAQCQVYGGRSAEHPGSTRAVEATARRILTSRGKPAFTQFAASSGGWTSAGSFPYLPAKRDPWDGFSGNPYHSWRVRLDDRDLERRWPVIGDLRNIETVGRDGNGQWGGRVGTVRLRGSQGRVSVSGDDFPYLMGLRSTWFTFVVS